MWTAIAIGWFSVVAAALVPIGRSQSLEEVVAAGCYITIGVLLYRWTTQPRKPHKHQPKKDTP
jgi:hypothetical protein